MPGRQKSWREIDRARDGVSSDGRKDDRSSLERALEDPRFKDKYLKEAERLFAGPKGSEQHPKDLRAIHETYGTARFEGAVRHYLERYGLPDDWATLMLILDFKGDPDIVSRAIDALIALVPAKGLIERKGLKGRLKVLSLSAKDLSVREIAESRLGELE